jgi:hypothetical protein
MAARTPFLLLFFALLVALFVFLLESTFHSIVLFQPAWFVRWLGLSDAAASVRGELLATGRRQPEPIILLAPVRARSATPVAPAGGKTPICTASGSCRREQEKKKKNAARFLGRR